MIIQLPTGSTRAYYERNAIDASIFATLDARAPHVLTTRISYTVPANRKALVTNVYSRAYRSVVAAPVGIVRVWFVKNLAGTPVYTMDSFSMDNVIGRLWENSAPMNYFLIPGDTVTFQSSDASTGGVVYYAMCANITEFDA